MKRRWLYLLPVFLPLIVIGFFVVAALIDLSRTGDVVWTACHHDHVPLEAEGIEMQADVSELPISSATEVTVLVINDTEYPVYGWWEIEKKVDGQWFLWGYYNVDTVAATSENGTSLEGYTTKTATLSFDEFLPEREPGEYRVIYTADVNLGNQGNPHKSVNGYKKVRGCLFAYFTLE